MKRGFKAEATRNSLALREKLKVKYNEALDCFQLAKSMEIPAFPVDKLIEFGFSTEQIETICYAKGKQQFSEIGRAHV